MGSNSKSSIELQERVRRIFVGPLQRNHLNLKKVAAGLTACFSNAVDLLEEARLLARNDRFARATALSVLALEELAKVPDLHDTAVIAEVTGDPKRWGSFWQRFVRHGNKQDIIAVYGKHLASLLQDQASPLSNPLPYAAFLPEGIASELDTIKQRCLYVDHWGGQFAIPAKTAAELPELLDMVFGVGEERADSFAAYQVTVARSLECLDESLEQSSRLQQASSDEERRRILRSGRPRAALASGRIDALELQADIRTLLVHRSSSEIPDYTSVWSFGDELFGGVPAKLLVRVFEAECETLRDRLAVKQLPSSAQRALGMLKLAQSYLDHRGVLDSVRIVWGAT